MQLTTETFSDVLVIHTPDELVESTAGPLLETIQQHLTQGTLQVVLQMDRSEAFDSAGLTALLDLQDLVRQHGGELCLSGLTPLGREVLRLTRLDQRLEMFDTLETAAARFR
jgi:anti-anti-sigma factor